MKGARNSNGVTSAFVAVSAAMMDVIRRVEPYARTRTPLVLIGAPGMGRRALAEHVHAWSGRSGPMVCSSAGLLGPRLERRAIFGREGPATQGGPAHWRGLLEEAADGTLLLADFEYFRPLTQRMVLEAVEFEAFRPVGAQRDLPLRCRLIIAIRDEPDVLVERGVLAEGVRFALGYDVIRLPTLDERREDIPSLACLFLERCRKQTGVPGPSRFTPAALSVLRAARWPGHLWQLRAVIRTAYLRAQRIPALGVEHLAGLVQWPLRFERHGNAAENARAVRFALDVTEGRARDAALLLHTAASTIYRYQTHAPRRDRADLLSDSPARNRESDASHARER